MGGKVAHHAVQVASLGRKASPPLGDLREVARCDRPGKVADGAMCSREAGKVHHVALAAMVSPQKEIIWSRIVCASRMPPQARRAMGGEGLRRDGDFLPTTAMFPEAFGRSNRPHRP
jgi:hypothetical protein